MWAYLFYDGVIEYHPLLAVAVVKIAIVMHTIITNHPLQPVSELDGDSLEYIAQPNLLGHYRQSGHDLLSRRVRRDPNEADGEHLGLLQQVFVHRALLFFTCPLFFVRAALPFLLAQLLQQQVERELREPPMAGTTQRFLKGEY